MQDGGTSSVPQDVYARMKLHIRNRILKTTQLMKSARIECAFGSSGTIINLAEIAMNMHERVDAGRKLVLSCKDLRKVVSTLCMLPLDERKKIQGINPERADIIGTGESGALPVLDEVKVEAKKRGVTLIITKTEEACRALEKAGSRTNAVLHLTC